MNDLLLQTINGHFDYLDCMIITSRTNDSVIVLNHTHVMSLIIDVLFPITSLAVMVFL